MRITRIPTKQGHPFPSQRMEPRGPFPPELFREPEIIVDYDSQPDGGGDPIPEGSTAQNNFRELRWFRCRLCQEVLIESALDDHICEDEDEEEEDEDDYTS